MFKVPTPKEFEEKVRRHLEETILFEQFYLMCIEELNKLNLNDLTEYDVKRIIDPFLTCWGQMGRVLRQRKGWQGKLAGEIRKIANVIDKLREKDLSNVNDEELNELEGDVEKCYSAIRKVIGPTSAAKVLHILAPDFFPLWDMAIRKLYGVKRDDWKGYFGFMQKTRRYWFKSGDFREVLLRLEKEFGLGKLRIIDVYNWLEGNKD